MGGKELPAKKINRQAINLTETLLQKLQMPSAASHLDDDNGFVLKSVFFFNSFQKYSNKPWLRHSRLVTPPSHPAPVPSLWAALYH